MEKVNLAEKLSRIGDYWNPRVVGELNGQEVRLARIRGDFLWHRHESEDEMFLVLEGRLAIHLRDRTVALGPGEFLVVPRGVEHKPEALPEAAILLFEPASTLNTGNVRNERTRDRLEKL